MRAETIEMSNFEKFHDAANQAFSNAVNEVVAKSNLDWEQYAGPIFEAMVQDILDDFELMLYPTGSPDDYKKRTTEAVVSVTLDANYEVGAIHKPLSQILIERYKSGIEPFHDGEHLAQSIEKSVAVFRKYLANNA